MNPETFIIGRHFEDEDDLSRGFDTELKPLDQQSPEMVESVVSDIVENTEHKLMTRLLIITSERKRTRTTSEIIKEKIKERKPDFSVVIRPDSRFDELDHGEPLLPEGYVKSKRIEYLKLAWEAFWTETFDQEGNYLNYNYKFGDPIESGGTVKYKGLENNFSKYGESYKELCLRYYKGVLDFLKNYERYDDKNINVVLIAHSATTAIINKIYEVLGSGKDFKPGELMSVCWKMYLEEQKISGGYKNILGGYKIIDLSSIDLSRATTTLEDEIKYLEK